MMQKFLLLLFVLPIHAVKAQNYTPFPDSGAIWVNAHLEENWGNGLPFPYYETTEVDNYCVNGEDTTIGSFNYTKVSYCGGQYKGALRDNGGQVFFVPKDSVSEYMLYDFTVSVGDTLTDIYIHPIWFEPMIYDVVVVAIDSSYINGDYRTRIQLEDGGEWTEGIGCHLGLFAETWPNVSQYYHQLICMSHNDTTLYPTVGSGSCALDLGFTNQKTSSKISVYPNPTNSEFEILCSELRAETLVTITNSSGQKIHPEINRSENSIQVDLTAYPAGIYFVTLMNDGNFYSLKIVKR